MSSLKSLLESHTALILGGGAALTTFILMAWVFRAQSQTPGGVSGEKPVLTAGERPAATPPSLDGFAGRVQTATFALG